MSTHICPPHDSVGKNLEIRQATTKFEIDQLRAALNDEHYLMAGRPAGNTVWQGIYQTDGENLSAIKANQGNYEKYARQLLEGRPMDLVDELERGKPQPLETGRQLLDGGQGSET